MERAKRNRLQWEQQEAGKLQQRKDDAAKAFWNRKPNALGSIEDAYFDDINLPTGEPLTPRQQYQLGLAFTETLKKTTPYELTDAGRLKLGCYMLVQSANGRALTAETAMKCFERLQSLGCFAPYEVTFDDSRAVPEQPTSETEKTFDELLETTSTDTREGARKLRNAAENEYLSIEARDMFAQWRAQLYKDYHFVPSKEHQIIVANWFRDNNKSFLRHAEYDAARRYMVLRKGLWPNTMLTPDERLAVEIEQTDLSRLSFDKRAELVNKVQAIQNVHGQSVRTS